MVYAKHKKFKRWICDKESPNALYMPYLKYAKKVRHDDINALSQVRIFIGKFLHNHYQAFSIFTDVHQRAIALHGTIGAIIDHSERYEHDDMYDTWLESRREQEDDF